MRMGVVTYEQLSNMSVVSILFSSNLFNGKGNPALWFMVRIADVLEIPVTDLLEKTDLNIKSL